MVRSSLVKGLSRHGSAVDQPVSRQRSESVIKLSRTQRRRTDRRIGRVGGSFIGILVVPYALPIGIVLWLLGSVIGLAALVVLILAVF